MIMFKETLSLAVTLILVTTCFGRGGKNDVSVLSGNGDVEVIDIDKAREEKMLLYSSVFEAPDVILLENSPECVIQNICAIEMYKDHIYILDDKVPALYVFRKDGSFLRRIGHQGRGHGEYLELSDFSIDRAHDVIYLWDGARDMAHKFDLKTNKYLSSIETKRDGYWSFCMQHVGDKLYLNHTSLDVSPENYLLREIDEKTGEQTGSYLKADDYNKGWNFSLSFPFSYFYSKNTDAPKFVEMFSDTIVAVTKDGVVPYCVVKSKDFVTNEEMGELIERNGPGDKFNYDISGLYDGGWIYNIARFVELDGMVSFQYWKGIDRHYLLHDLETKATRVSQIFADDYLCENNNLPVDMCYSDEKGVLSVLRIDFIPYLIENIISKGRLNPEIDDYEKLMQIKEDANPVLFFHPYKQGARLEN